MSDGIDGCQYCFGTGIMQYHSARGQDEGPCPKCNPPVEMTE